MHWPVDVYCERARDPPRRRVSVVRACGGGERDRERTSGACAVCMGVVWSVWRRVVVHGLRACWVGRAGGIKGGVGGGYI